jgi:hypothetical protein
MAEMARIRKHQCTTLSGLKEWHNVHVRRIIGLPQAVPRSDKITGCNIQRLIEAREFCVHGEHSDSFCRGTHCRFSSSERLFISRYERQQTQVVLRPGKREAIVL